MFQLLWTQLEDKKHVATMEEIEYYYMHSVKNNKFSDMFVKVKLWGQSSSSFPKKHDIAFNILIIISWTI